MFLRLSILLYINLLLFSLQDVLKRNMRTSMILLLAIGALGFLVFSIFATIQANQKESNQICTV